MRVVCDLQASLPANFKEMREKFMFPGDLSGPVRFSAVLNQYCGRDHKWELMQQAIDRQVCDCKRQFRQALEVYRLWNCTHNHPENPYPPLTPDEYVPPPQRVCEYPGWANLSLSSPWKHSTTWDPSLGEYRLTDQAIRFPREGDEHFYFRDCSHMTVRNCTLHPTWDNDGQPCVQFCSWKEMSDYIDRKVCNAWWVWCVSRADSPDGACLFCALCCSTSRCTKRS